MKNAAKTLNVWLITVAVFLALLLKNSKQTQQRTSDGLGGDLQFVTKENIRFVSRVAGTLS